MGSPFGARDKRWLREALLRARRQTPIQEVVDKSAAIREKVAATEIFSRSLSISCYMALGTEVQTVPLIELALAQGKRVAVPKVGAQQRELELYWITSVSEGFRPGPFGILEPTGEAGARASVTEIELFLVPGVVFDEEGWRIGFGKGYYDRLFLRAGSRACRIGLAFEFQVVPRCPHGPHDVPMHYVVTEQRVIRGAQVA